MKKLFKVVPDLLESPVSPAVRLILLVLVVPIALTFTRPIWNISMKAPQYPSGLELDIFVYKVEGGHAGHDIKEINTLNHYIGMAPIDRQQLSDLDWMPFALGIIVLLVLRVALIGNVRALVDISVLSLYFCLFSLFRFVYKLHWLGHNLDPSAPVDVEPFTPAIFGTKQIANFTVTSLPRMGSLFLAIFVIGLVVALTWQTYFFLKSQSSRG